MKKIFNYFPYYSMLGIQVLIRKLCTSKLKKRFKPFIPFFDHKVGFEIGGPSLLFEKSIMPVYKLAKKVDGCNFSNETVWEGKIKGEDYNYSRGLKGRQYIAEAMDLADIEDSSYDFILSCHSLEHTANPLKSLMEWKRILKKGGVFLIIVPDKRFTFDRNRQNTTFSHLLADLQDKTNEGDLTHLHEILNLHDFGRDPGANQDREQFKERSKNNLKNRCLHHHVFSSDLLRESIHFLDMEPLASYFIPPFHKVIFAMKA